MSKDENAGHKTEKVCQKIEILEQIETMEQACQQMETSWAKMKKLVKQRKNGTT